MKTTVTNDLLEVAAATWWPPVTADELSYEEQSPEQLVVAAQQGQLADCCSGLMRKMT